MPIQSANPPDIVTLIEWKGINQQTLRGAIDDQELWWSENLYGIGAGNLRSCWGPSTPVYAAPAGITILRIFFGYFGMGVPQFGMPPPGRFGYMFLSDGNVDQVDLDTQAVTRLGQIWEPIAPYYWASLKVWRPQWVGAAIFTATSAAIATAGTGYAVGDTINLAQGVVLTVTTVNATGGITGTSVTSAGSSQTPPANPLSQLATSGSGTGATFNVVWTQTVANFIIASATVYNAGTGYAVNDTINLPYSIELTVTTVGPTGNVTGVSITNAGSAISPPANPLAQVSTSGGGIGATFNVTWTQTAAGSGLGQQGGIVIGSPKGLYAWDGTTLSSPGDDSPEWLSNEVPGVDPISPMPVGLPGIYAMEVYQERLWVAGKDVISFSAPTNGANFSTVRGGGSFGYYGDKLRASYMDLAASAGYLFCFGDSSTDVISNVTFSGGGGNPATPITTNFLYANVDPMVGHGFPRPVGAWGRYFMLCNGDARSGSVLEKPGIDAPFRGGIYLMFGGDAQYISGKISGTYMTLDTSTFFPTFAPCMMFGYRLMLLNGMFRDPFGVKRSMLLAWNGETWWPMSQSQQGIPINLTHIGSYEDNSVIQAYGTDGLYLYRLFDHPDTHLIKRFHTKALRIPENSELTIRNWKRLFMEFTDYYGNGVSFTGTMTTRGGGVPGGIEDIGFELTKTQQQTAGAPPNKAFEPMATSGMGITAEIDLTSQSPDFSIERFIVAAEQRTFFGA